MGEFGKVACFVERWVVDENGTGKMWELSYEERLHVEISERTLKG